MQKVVSICFYEGFTTKTSKEFEFPMLDKYLNEGYSIVQTIPQSISHQGGGCAITFILEKR